MRLVQSGGGEPLGMGLERDCICLLVKVDASGDDYGIVKSQICQAACLAVDTERWRW